MYCLWDRSKTFSASERLLWALIRQNAIFLKSHLTMWPLSLGRDSQLDHCDTELILLDTSWHWVDTQLFCSCSQPVLGGGIGTERQFIIVIIVISHYLCKIFNCWLHWSLQNWGQTDQLTMLELSRGFTLTAFDITVPDPTIHLQRLRFHSKWVLNCTAW